MIRPAARSAIRHLPSGSVVCTSRRLSARRELASPYNRVQRITMRGVLMIRTRTLLRSFIFAGLVGANVLAQRAPIAQQLSFTPYHANGIYEVGETVGWTVTPGPTPPIYAYKWTIRRNNAVV